MPVISYHFTSLSSDFTVLLMWKLTTQANQDSMNESAFNCCSVSCHTILTIYSVSSMHSNNKLENLSRIKVHEFYSNLSATNLKGPNTILEPRFSLYTTLSNFPYGCRYSCLHGRRAVNALSLNSMKIRI